VSWVACRRGLASVVAPAAALFELPDSHRLKEAVRQGWVEQLDLTDNAGVPCTDQLDLQELPRLGFQVSDDETLERLPPLPALRELYLNNCTATRTELEWLRDFPKLEYVHIGTAGLGDSEVGRLLGVPNLRSLTVAVHYGARQPLTDAGLTVLGRLTGLRRLAVADCLATDSGLEALLGLTELEELSVGASGGTRFTERGLDVLARLPRLRSLTLLPWGWPCSDEALDRLRAARPDLVIRR
jgi:hypothetical protein